MLIDLETRPAQGVNGVYSEFGQPFLGSLFKKSS
jgi:hypothetical protein